MFECDIAVWVVVVRGVAADDTVRWVGSDAVVINYEEGEVCERFDDRTVFGRAGLLLVVIVGLVNSAANKGHRVFVIDVAFDGRKNAVLGPRRLVAQCEPRDMAGVQGDSEFVPVLTALLTYFSYCVWVALTSSVGFVKRKMG